MSEKWLPVPDYEGLYEVSDHGNIRSLFRYKKTLKWNIGKNGYATVQLFKNKTGKRLLVHRIVASAFIRLPYEKEQVNHIDENKLNNTLINLEWVTPLENMNYGTRLQRQKAHTDYSTLKRKIIAIKNGKSVSKPVIQISKTGEIIKVFNSAKEAHIETGLNHSHIIECCKGKRYKTVGGYVWKYERNDDLLVSRF